MNDEQWRRIAGRIESTWPGASAGEGYRAELGDMPPGAVERALDELLIEYRNAAPPADVVRRHAAAVSADAAVVGASAGEPPPTTPPPTHTRPAQDAPPESRRATAALILGTAGLVTVPVVVSIIAIVTANRALAEIEENPGLGGAQRARTGRMLGYIELTIVALAIVIGVIIALSA